LIFGFTKSLVSEKLIRFGRCIGINYYGKMMKIRLYRENELTGEIENNDSNAWPVRMVMSEFQKSKGYELVRVYLPNITDIKMKTKNGENPVIYSNNLNVEIPGVIAIKYGFPSDIKKKDDFISKNNVIDYSKFGGRKFHFGLRNKGQRLKVRCTIINPDLGEYKGYLFPRRRSPDMLPSDLIKIEKEDYLKNKEIIPAAELDSLQMKMDGLDNIKKIEMEKRSQKRRKKMREKFKEKMEKEKLLKAGLSLDEIKKKKVRMKRKVNRDKKKLGNKYQDGNAKAKKKVPKAGTVEELKENNQAQLELTKTVGKLDDHDVRINEEDDVRNNVKKKKNDDDVTSEVTFQNNIDHVEVSKPKTDRKYSIEKSLLRMKTSGHGHPHLHLDVNEDRMIYL
jgi:hypothetical protein